MADVVIARVLHVLAVVIWIGRVLMVTSVALPAVRRNELGGSRLRSFQVVEHRFVWLHAMVCVWVLYLFVLFVAEPFILRRHFDRWARARPEAALSAVNNVGRERVMAFFCLAAPVRRPGWLADVFCGAS